MKFTESFNMATKTLLANKMRSALTMLGIVIGNAAVIGTIGVGEGAQSFVSAQVQSLGPNLLFIRPGSPQSERRPVSLPQTLIFEDAKAIARQVPTIEAVAPELNSSELVSYRGNNVSASIIGTVPEYLPVRSFVVDRGRFISDLDMDRNKRVAAIGSELAKQLFEGKDPLGESVRVRNTRFEIIGVMGPKGSSFGQNQDQTLFIPLRTMASQLVGRRRTNTFGTPVTFISATAKDETVMAAAQFQIENLLRQRHKIKNEDDFTVRNQQDLQNTLGSITGAVQILLAAVASISLVVGGIGIMNIMLVSVTERTQEIGLRKAIGASQEDILSQFIIEAFILSAIGGLIGTGVGAVGISAIGLFTPLRATISLGAVVLAVGVSGAIGLFFGVIPARQAAQLDPIVALRSA